MVCRLSTRPLARHRASSGLLAEPKSRNRCAVSLYVLAGQVGQQATALADELEKPSARVKVVFVRAQMIGQTVDSFGQQGNLDLRRASIIFMGAKLGDNCLFLL